MDTHNGINIIVRRELSLLLFDLGNSDVHIFQPAYQFSSIEKPILYLHYPLLIRILRGVFSSAKTTSGPCNRSRHTVSLPPSRKVGGDVGRELQSIEVPTDQSICIELLHSRKEVAIECKPSAVAQHAE